MGNVTIDELVKMYDLQPHPEGGYFKETYRATETLETQHGTRNHSTTIYFLIPEGKKSHLHRIKSDEVWHFYLGDPMTVVQISPKGVVQEIVLGSDIKNGQHLQHTVPAGYWFGSYPNPGSQYSFVGCTVAPGFDFADFEMAKRNELLNQYPQAKNIIERLTDQRCI